MVLEPTKEAHQINIQPEMINAIDKKLQIIIIYENAEDKLKLTLEELERKGVPYYQIVDKFWAK